MKQITVDCSGKPFGKRLRNLKKDFEQNIQPALRRHRFAKSKRELERAKHTRHLRKMKSRASRLRKARLRAKRGYQSK